jgi:parallel beta-helix repeat protein
VVEDNLLEDNGRLSILYEISREGIIRNNIVRRSGWQGIGLVTSKAMEIYGNTIEDSGRGIGLYLYCPAPIGVGRTGWDLADNFIHDNVIKVAAASGAFANSFLHAGCATAQVAPYVDGSKNNRFANNRYFVTAMTGTYWQWGDSTMLTWAEWQARGQDTTGSVQSVANFPASR